MVLDSSSLNKIGLLFEGFLAMIVMSYNAYDMYILDNILDFIITIISLSAQKCSRLRLLSLEMLIFKGL